MLLPFQLVWIKFLVFNCAFDQILYFFSNAVSNVRHKSIKRFYFRFFRVFCLLAKYSSVLPCSVLASSNFLFSFPPPLPIFPPSPFIYFPSLPLYLFSFPLPLFIFLPSPLSICLPSPFIYFPSLLLYLFSFPHLYLYKNVKRNFKNFLAPICQIKLV